MSLLDVGYFFQNNQYLRNLATCAITQKNIIQPNYSS